MGKNTYPAPYKGQSQSISPKEIINQAKKAFKKANYAEAIRLIQLLSEEEIKKHRLASKIQEITFQISKKIEKFPANQVSGTELSCGEIVRNAICTAGYQSRFSSLQAQHQQKLKADFKEQVSWVIELIQFIGENYRPDSALPPFIDPRFYGDSEKAKQLRFNQIGSYVFSLLKEWRNDFSKLVDQLGVKVFADAPTDIVLNDAKVILRMMFECIYHFPRAERGKLIKYLPWGENSWYLFDFCGALVIGREQQGSKINEITLLPYDFEGDIKKQRLLLKLQESVTEYRSTVNHALGDIIRSDLPMLHDFFVKIHAHLTTPSMSISPMPDLKYMRTLIWYGKQTFNALKLLAVLPFNEENCIYANEILMELSTAAAQPLDLPTGALKEKTGQDGPRKNSQTAMQILRPSVREKFQNACQNRRLYLGLLKDSSQLTPHMRLQLPQEMEYSAFTSLNSCLSLLRKIQLTGEIFLPRNWGHHLKTLSIINPECLSKIRNGLCHVEDWDYFHVAVLVENSPHLLNQIYEELKQFKRAVYELIVERQGQFKNWEKIDTSSGYNNWAKEMDLYWQTIISYYNQTKKDFTHYSPKIPLLDEKDCKVLYETLTPAHPHFEQVKAVVEGNIPYAIPADLTLGMEKGRRRKVDKYLKKAEKNYREHKKEAVKQHMQETQKNKKEIKAKRQAAMETYFPLLNAWSELYYMAESDQPQNVPVSVLVQTTMDKLLNRLELLFSLLAENEIDVTQFTKEKFQLFLFDYINENLNFSLSTGYLLGQIISFINKLSSIVDLQDISPQLKERLPDLVALRNALEHTDPILESSEISYFQMASKIPQLTAYVLGEIIFDYHQPIRAFAAKKRVENPAVVSDCSAAASSDLSVPTSSSSGLSGERQRQTNALRLSGLTLFDADKKGKNEGAVQEAQQNTADKSPPIIRFGFFDSTKQETEILDKALSILTINAFFKG
ncbi:hypothetical protein [Legionella sp.]|uniref:hypothetical protein n=1 Tax=Legionella sp. TaxID=459 RepID=UPI00321F6411